MGAKVIYDGTTYQLADGQAPRTLGENGSRLLNVVDDEGKSWQLLLGAGVPVVYEVDRDAPNAKAQVRRTR